MFAHLPRFLRLSPFTFRRHAPVFFLSDHFVYRREVRVRRLPFTAPP